MGERRRGRIKAFQVGTPTEIVDLKFRHYERGDEAGLAEVFVRAFQTNGASGVRTRKSWHWRYAERPGFEPEAVQVCVDGDAGGRVVGMVGAEVHECLVGGRRVLSGSINDVSTDPAYARRGIARRLLEMAERHFDERGVAFSKLTADPRGHARERLYLPAGYRDFVREAILFQLSSLGRLAFQQVPLLLPALPAMVALKFLTLWSRGWALRAGGAKFACEVVENPTNRQFEEFRKFLDRLGRRRYDWWVPLTREEWNWRYRAVPAPRFRRSFVTLRVADELAAVAILHVQNVYSFKLGLKVKLAVITEFLHDRRAFGGRAEELAATSGALLQLVRVAAKRGASALLCLRPLNDAFVVDNFRRAGMVVLPAGSVVMVKKRDETLELDPRRPFHLPAQDAFGTP
ncbi:MAG: hypothetical protein Kow0069_26780 [Promethearchaeota archaeon]